MSRHAVTLILFSSLLALSACVSRPTPGEIAAQTAKQYYDELVSWHYDKFVNGKFQPGKIPENFRDELITNAKMFIGQQNEAHKGIRHVRIDHATADTVRHVANVFLVFTYGDKTSEIVVVPMVEHKNTWYLR